MDNTEALKLEALTSSHIDWLSSDAMPLRHGEGPTDFLVLVLTLCFGDM